MEISYSISDKIILVKVGRLWYNIKKYMEGTTE